MTGARQGSSRLHVDQLSPIPAVIDTSSSDRAEEFPTGPRLVDFIIQKTEVINVFLS